MTVMAINKWATNGDLIADVASLDYLSDRVLDCTFGHGTFWTKHRPAGLVGCDLDPAKSPIGYAVNFTHMPFDDRSFTDVVIDGPYKLNGTPDPEIDARYGVHIAASREGRMGLLRSGVRECCRVADRHVLIKCQDQVNGGKVRWQSLELIAVAARCGFGLLDRFDFLSYRPQPDGRRQVTARRNSSQLLVVKRGHRS